MSGRVKFENQTDLNLEISRDLTMVAVSELQPLWGQFRNLPYQAISARLADVQPAQGDWKPEDTVLGCLSIPFFPLGLMMTPGSRTVRGTQGGFLTTFSWASTV